MEKTKQIANQNQDMKNKNRSKSSAITRTVAGGLIGAAVGYIATPENGKKLIKKLKPAKLKSAGSGLGQSVKDNSVKAVESLKNSAGKIFNKKEDVALEGYSNEEDKTSANETSLSTGIENKPEDNKEQKSNRGNSMSSSNDLKNEKDGLQKQGDESKSQPQVQADNGNSQSITKDYESLQKEHEKLQDRLGNIEELLTKVLQEKVTSQTSDSNKNDDESDEKTDSQSQNHDEVPDKEVEETYLKLNGLKKETK